MKQIKGQVLGQTVHACGPKGGSSEVFKENLEVEKKKQTFITGGINNTARVESYIQKIQLIVAVRRGSTAPWTGKTDL